MARRRVAADSNFLKALPDFNQPTAEILPIALLALEADLLRRSAARRLVLQGAIEARCADFSFVLVLAAREIGNSETDRAAIDQHRHDARHLRLTFSLLKDRYISAAGINDEDFGAEQIAGLLV